MQPLADQPEILVVTLIKMPGQLIRSAILHPHCYIHTQKISRKGEANAVEEIGILIFFDTRIELDLRKYLAAE